MPTVDDLRAALVACEQPPPPAGEFLAAMDDRTPARARRRILLPVLVAACVAAIAALGVVLARGGAPHHAPAANPTTPASPTVTDPARLVGVDWRLVAVIPTGATQPVPVPARPTRPDPVLRFDGKGHFGGQDTCNGIGGQVTIVGAGTIDVHITASTLIGCRAVIPTTVDATLNGRVAWFIQDNRLSLHKPGGATLVYQAETSR
jgi:heat shock protein HslJ